MDVLADGTGANEGLITDGFVQSAASTVDVLFVLDNSGSMDDNLNALNNEFPVFINQFVNLGLDYQIGVVSTDMDDPTHSGRLQGPIITTSTPDPIAQFASNTDVGTDGSLDEKGLDAAYAALSMPLIANENAGLVRPGSLLTVIAISDEPDQSDVDASTMISFLDTYQGDPTLSSFSIVGGPKTGILPCWRGIFPAAPVPKYWNVANNTGGIHANICNLDMSVILTQLSVVAAGLNQEYVIQGNPTDPSGIEVLVDGTPLVEDDPQNIRGNPKVREAYLGESA